MGEMKNTGIIRTLDELGRIVVPKEIRASNGFTEGTAFEIYIQDGLIILKKHEPYRGAADAILTVKENLMKDRYFPPKKKEELAKRLDDTLDWLKGAFNGKESE